MGSTLIKIVGLMLLLLFSGCNGSKENNKLYTITDHTGKVYTDMKIHRFGWGWGAFYTLEGKKIVLDSPYVYVEQ